MTSLLPVDELQSYESASLVVMAAVGIETDNAATYPRQYGKIVLTLENCLLPPEKIQPTPSSIDGLDAETEIDLRILGCELIQTAGILLRLPQVAMATGQVIFQRFFYSKSFVKQKYEVVAMGCVCLASKIEEAPRRMRDVINVFNHIKQVRSGKPIQPMILDSTYTNLKNQVIKAERRVLKELGFCVHVKHPHKIIVTFLNQVLDCKKNQKLAQLSWNYMNDSLRTNVFVLYNPETIACACIYLSARELKIPLPMKPAWYEIFNVTESDIQDICYTILRLYTRKKPDFEKLEKTVEDLSKAQQEAKMKARELAGIGTQQTASSPNSRSSSPLRSDKSPLDGSTKKDKSKDDTKAKESRTNSPITNNKENHAVQKHAHSPSSNRSGPKSGVSRMSSPSHSRSHSRSVSPKRKTRTPPRGYKDVRKSPTSSAGSLSASAVVSKTSRSRSRSNEHQHKNRDHKRRHTKSRSRSRSRSYSPHHNNKKSVSGSGGHREKSRRRSRSRDRTFNSRSETYDKLHTSRSRKDRSRDNGHHRSRSRDRSRR